MKPLANLLTLILIIVLFSGCQRKYKYDSTTEGFQNFLTDYESKIEPLFTKYNQAQWDSYITGNAELFDLSTKLSLQIDSIYQHKTVFDYLKNLRENKIVKDDLLKRQLNILYNAYLSRQINPELNKNITEHKLVAL